MGGLLMKKQYMPLFIVQCILILFICSSLLAENLISKANPIPAVSTSTKYFTDAQLNHFEQKVLNVLAGCRLWDNGTKAGYTRGLSTYQNILMEYFCRTDVNITSSEGKEAIRKINELRVVLNMEKNDISSMPLDTREFAIRILKEVYEIFGLKLSLSLQGDIIQVVDDKGYCLYKKESDFKVFPGFRLDVFIIILLIILFFLFLCLFIAKKYHVFVKDVVFDGFNKEGYA